MRPKPLVLVILDGWGWREEKHGNAVLQAQTPTWNALWASYPKTFLRTSSENVGLPPKTIGNSEVGHLNIGAGRIVRQDLSLINHTIETGAFFSNPVLLSCMRAVKQKKTKLHLIGLCSDVGVHAHLNHLEALLKLSKQEELPSVCIHAITDGRDSSPTAGKGYLERVEAMAQQSGNARIATVIGRYLAMDRDKRWERTEKAWRMMVKGEGQQAKSAPDVAAASYAAGITDEFIPPTVLDSNGLIADGDAVIFFNFRADRARQLTRVLALDDFDGFERRNRPKLSHYVCMTEYDETFGLPIAFESEVLKNLLGQVLADHGLKQLRIAETEKYAHVTYFFNGGEERAFDGEDRCLIQSPRDVATYDLKPEMSALQVTEEILKRIASNRYDVIILNFANPDMVGHTGNLPAAIKAVETVDACLGRIVPLVLKQGGALLITADHGNCEEMFDAQGNPHTSHTFNLVPCVYVSAPKSEKSLTGPGKLCDLAPTLLDALGIAKPVEMTGNSLFQS
ncbi:MAG: 2,3-bisphosphoglycerate-independent phosphoglycerate mutase [Deltaproteobacteria bacterium]|nr:2,3-bisphosphoglycerate-independent phosphoglycerate mutase [Deltaproteobacteria bacterium]